MKKINKISTGTTAAMSLALLLASGLIMNETSTSGSDSIAPLYSSLMTSLNNYSYVGQKTNITMSMKDEEILAKKNIVTLKNCMNEEPAEFGEEVSYSTFFEMVRSQDNYSFIFQEISSISNNFKLSLLVLLSQIDYNGLFEFEKNFVLEQLHSDLLSNQERALNTISLWNNSELLPNIIDVKINNRFLQKRLMKIIDRFEK